SATAVSLSTPSVVAHHSPYELYEMRIRGTAFLYHQVRCMTAILFEIGMGYESESLVEDLLDVPTLKDMGIEGTVKESVRDGAQAQEDDEMCLEEAEEDEDEGEEDEEGLEPNVSEEDKGVWKHKHLSELTKEQIGFVSKSLETLDKHSTQGFSTDSRPFMYALKPHYNMTPDFPLILWEIEYDTLHFTAHRRALIHTMSLLHAMITRSVVKQGMLRLLQRKCLDIGMEVSKQDKLNEERRKQATAEKRRRKKHRVRESKKISTHLHSTVPNNVSLTEPSSVPTTLTTKKDKSKKEEEEPSSTASCPLCSERIHQASKDSLYKTSWPSPIPKPPEHVYEHVQLSKHTCIRQEDPILPFRECIPSEYKGSTYFPLTLMATHGCSAATPLRKRLPMNRRKKEMGNSSKVATVLVREKRMRECREGVFEGK
ncbi:Pseudouridine synthase I, TruA like protein, partial [Aduncisulcus paluster]